MKKILVDTKEALVKALYDTDEKDVIVVAVIPSAVTNVKAAVEVIGDWMAYAAAIKDKPEHLAALEVLENEEELYNVCIEPVPYVIGHIPIEEPSIPYVPISQMDDPPGWFVEPGTSMTVIHNRYNHSIERGKEGSTEGVSLIHITSVDTDFVPDRDDLLEETPIGAEWVSMLDNYWDSMGDSLPKRARTSTLWEAWAVGTGPDKYSVERLCRKYLEQNNIQPKEGWMALDTTEMMNYLDELRTPPQLEGVKRVISLPKKRKVDDQS